MKNLNNVSRVILPWYFDLKIVGMLIGIAQTRSTPSMIPGGYSWEFLVGVCRPVLEILTLFQTKKCYFSHPFSDLASKKLCHHYLEQH